MIVSYNARDFKEDMYRIAKMVHNNLVQEKNP